MPKIIAKSYSSNKYKYKYKIQNTKYKIQNYYINVD